MPVPHYGVDVTRSPLSIAGGSVRLMATEVPLAGAAVKVRAARLADVPAMLELLDGFAARGLLLPRTADQLHRHFREFVVAVDDGGVVGCGALRIYDPTLAEVGALAVAERSHGRGIGRRIVEALLAEARALRLERVIALTLQEAFFHRIGFRTVRVEAFPAKIAADCAGCAKRATCHEIAVVYDLHS